VFVSVADESHVPPEALRVWQVASGTLTERGAA
jgi:hypothetical protein